MKKIAVILALFLSVGKTFSQEKITVFADQHLDSTNLFMQGFLHGGSASVDSQSVAKLKPAFWRIGAYFLAGSGYAETKRFNPKITVNINDLYMIVNNITSQTLSQPWSDGWVAWDDLVTMIATNSINNNEPVDYWDVWGEPDNFWTGNYNQWIEMYRRTDSILTAIIPTAKLIGPAFGFGTCNFNVHPILQFLDSLYAEGSSVSGVSWHEFCNPQEVPMHVQQVKDSLAVRPWLGQLDILLPEYAGPTNHTIPGWNLGWLYYLEKAQVNWVSHGCWDETDGTSTWSNCQVGLNGLFMPDNSTPQPNYWVHRAYAELNATRLVSYSSESKTVALASKEEATQEMKIIAGRYDNPNLGSHNASANVEIKIKNYPYCSNCTKPIVIQRIPSNDTPYSIPLLVPSTSSVETVNFVGDSASIFINNFVDGDVYIVYINPTSTSVLSLTEQKEETKKTNIQVSPNPTSEFLTIHNLENALSKEPLQLYNSLGIFLKELPVFTNEPINISDLPNGLYFVGIRNNPQSMQKFLKIQ